MRILHAYNQHRGGGGATNAARATVALSRQRGMEVEVYTRSSAEMPDHVVGRLRTAASAIYARRSVREFSALLDSFRPDVVHIHEVFPLVSPWILPPCTRRGVPVVMTCVDYRLTCPVFTHQCGGEVCTRCTGGREYHAVLRNCRGNLAESAVFATYNVIARKVGLFRQHVSQYIAPSEFTRQWLIEQLHLAPDRVTAISPAVTVPDEPVADPVAGQYVAYAGRFSPEKGIDTLIEAARIARLPLRLSRNENSLVTANIPPDVTTVVTRDRSELLDFYRSARMLVLPSTWFETFALVGAEAMSHGVPVIASRFGAMAELLEDGVDGFLFEPRNPADLAAKITRLWNDPDLCRRMGAAAREKAVRLWRGERHAERLAELYADVCARRASAPITADRSPVAQPAPEISVEACG
jgi:glycosyltransferase involved in cell wall biosynthesis